MVRRLRIPKEVAALLRGLHPGIKRKVRAAFEDILDHPEAGKALKDELVGFRSYRVGRMRVIYRISSRTEIDIVATGPRKLIYEETLRLIRKEGGRGRPSGPARR